MKDRLFSPYSTPIFQDYLGLDRQLALILGAVLSTVYALSACISFPLVDRFGRRNLFFIGSIGQSLSMFLIMACLIPGTSSPAINGSVVGYAFSSFIHGRFEADFFFLLLLFSLL